MAPPANGSLLKPNEEEWRDIFNRLSERFPSVPGKRIAQVLRDHKGHAGEAARTLRDQTGSQVKEADPDDVEHVATLLSSPVMFKHACKEKFKKFDTNGDGVLEFHEVRDLTNALYEEFGLEIPSEGALLAFFTATDENQDGVLSDREFRKFFEMFLRYAFFDHLKLRQVVEKGQEIQARRNSMKLDRRATEVWNLGADETESRSSSKEALFADAPSMPAETVMARAQSTPVLTPIQEPTKSPKASGKRDKHDKHRHGRQDKDQERNRTTSDNSFCRTLRCVAPAGVAYRSSTTFPDRKDVIAGKGDVVQVLEHWVRTPDGWLPVFDPNGHALFESTGAGPEDASGYSASGYSAFHSPANANKKRVSISEKKSDLIVRSASPSPQRSASGRSAKSEGNLLKPNEEEWRPVMERLMERFPHLGEDKVVQALRDNEGHAGKAASMLRYM